MQVVDKIDRLYKYKDECKISNLAVKRSLEVYHLLDGDCNMFPLESYKGHVMINVEFYKARLTFIIGAFKFSWAIFNGVDKGDFKNCYVGEDHIKYDIELINNIITDFYNNKYAEGKRNENR